MNQERLDVHVEFRKARGTKDQKDQVASIHWVIEKSRDFKIKKKKILLLLHWLCSAGHNKLWKILKEMGIPEHLICLLKNLYARQGATVRTVRTRHGTMDWFKTGKGVTQGCILLPCLFNLYAEYIMHNAGRMNHKLESRLLVGYQGQPKICRWYTTLMAKNAEELKNILIKVNEESEKNWLKTQHSKVWDHGIQSYHFMTEDKKMETVTDYFLGLQIHCRWWLRSQN